MKTPKLTPAQRREILREHLAKIGAIGGRKSRRTLTPEQARAMVEARERRKLQRQRGARRGRAYPAGK